MTVSILCIALTISVPARCQYSHAKEMGLKGPVKTVTEYDFEAIKQKGSYDKAARIPYHTSVTHFNKDGNIRVRNKIMRGPNLVKDSVLLMEEYNYVDDKYVGHTEFKGNIAVYTQKRKWIDDRHYVDTFISYQETKDNIGELIYVAEFWLNDDYTPHTCHFMYPKTHLEKARETTYTYQYPSEKIKVFARDAKGNSTAEVEDKHWEVPDETNLGITEYSYEYY